MEFAGEHVIPAPIDRVWDGLNDPEILRRSIPGCTDMSRTGENEFTATVVTKVGPVSATFKGKVEITDLDPPNGYTLSGRGQGGAAGFAKGAARIRLSEDAEGTRLAYTADVEIGGKLASVGGRLIQSVAKKNAEDFFTAFSNVLTGKAPAPEAVAAGTEPGTPAPVAAPGGHIPLIDRLAWLMAGIGIGVIAMLIVH